MMITRISPFTGFMHTLDINVTQEQIDLWQTGTLPIQRALPNLTPDEREFIMTGITADEWDNAFGEDCTEKLEDAGGEDDWNNGWCDGFFEADIDPDKKKNKAYCDGFSQGCFNRLNTGEDA